uniref:Auxin-responsive protein n=1 Tax=Davidia involucrata TaxID=16924 RepID=A0A5B7AWQ0_DAVIN
MELQLGLALSSNPIKGFDLNSYVYEPKEVLGSDSLNHFGSCLSTKSIMDHKKNKRCFDEAFGQSIDDVPQTLPLFWNSQPNQEDYHKELHHNSFITNKIGDEDVVGWPPIKSWRKKLSYQNHGGHNGGGGRGSKSMYVKVKMEGVAIGRKIDLSQHRSYQTLTDALIGMFWKCQENVKAYKLAYQDKEGDWLLAGDLPWRTFIRSAQRLKLLRTNG